MDRLPPLLIGGQAQEDQGAAALARFAVVEECFAYDECAAFSPFVEAGKAVFVAEYEKPLSAICDEAKELRFSVIKKGYDLFAKPWRPCVGAG